MFSKQSMSMPRAYRDLQMPDVRMPRKSQVWTYFALIEIMTVDGEIETYIFFSKANLSSKEYKYKKTNIIVFFNKHWNILITFINIKRIW